MTKTEDDAPPEKLTREEVIRLFNEAKRRGEPTRPIIRRYVIQAIREAMVGLKGSKDPPE